MIQMKSIVLGSHNPHKQEKLRWLVKGYVEEILLLPKDIQIEESGESLLENAKLKALMMAKRLKKNVIATDGGADIPALGKKWNSVLTKRFLGREQVSDWDRIEGLLELMKPFKDEERLVIWREAVAIARDDGEIVFSTEVEGDRGLIQTDYDRKQYRPGIWLCTLWSYPQFGGKNFFELDEDECREGEISWWKLKKKVDESFNL